MTRGPLDEHDAGRVPTNEECRAYQDRYRAMVLHANARQGSSRLIVCVGVVASGKSTVMRRIAERLNAVYVEGDEVRAMLDADGVTRKARVRILKPLIIDLIGQGYTVVHGSDAAGRVDELRQLTSTAGVPLDILHITAPKPVILERLTAREAERKEPTIESWIETYNRRASLHADLSTVSFTCTIDTSAKDADSQIESCLQKLKSQASGL